MNMQQVRSSEGAQQQGGAEGKPRRKKKQGPMQTATNPTTLKEKQAKLLQQTSELATMSESARLAKLKREVATNPALTSNKALQQSIDQLEAKHKKEQQEWAARISGAYG